MKISSKMEKCGLSPMRKFNGYAAEAVKRGIKIYHLNIGQPDIITPDAYFQAMREFSEPVLAPFIYGTLERLLLPFGLHHMLTIPMNYTSFGGTYTIQTGANAGTQVFGQDPLWLAWVTDLINFKNAGDTASYNALLEGVTPARFKVGQMIGATGLLTFLIHWEIKHEEEALEKQN